MAWINALNDSPGVGGEPPPAIPRISFSNDFAGEAQQPPPRRDAVTPDPGFEFTVGVRPMIAADELFFEGRMLPLRHSHPPPSSARGVTLRDELRALDGGGDGGLWGRQPRRNARWKELLGLGRAYSRHSVRKQDKANGCSDTVGAVTESSERLAGKLMQEGKRPSYDAEDAV